MPHTLAWTLILAACLVLAFAANHIFAWFRSRRPDPALATAPPRDGPLSPPSPLTRISFQEALAGTGLEDAINDSCLRSLRSALTGDGAIVAIQAVSLEKGSRALELVCTFSRSGSDGYRNGTLRIAHGADGRLLPELRDGHGRFFEIAQGGRDLLGRLAEASALVTSCAHIISSIDVVRRLERIERALAKLSRNRCNDQYATLGRIYMRSQERLSRVPYGKEDGMLQNYRDELCELRLALRRDMECALVDVPNPSVADWQIKLLPESVVDWRRAKLEIRTHESLQSVAEIASYIGVALFVDICIAQWDGTVDGLFAHPLRSEANGWGVLLDRLDSLIAHLRRDRPARQLAEGLRDAITGFSKLGMGDLDDMPPEPLMARNRAAN